MPRRPTGGASRASCGRRCSSRRSPWSSSPGTSACAPDQGIGARRSVVAVVAPGIATVVAVGATVGPVVVMARGAGVLALVVVAFVLALVVAGLRMRALVVVMGGGLGRRRVPPALPLVVLVGAPVAGAVRVSGVVRVTRLEVVEHVELVGVRVEVLGVEQDRPDGRRR